MDESNPSIQGLEGAVLLYAGDLLPDFAGRMRLMQDAFPRFLRWSQQQPVALDGSWVFALVGALLAAVPIWFLVRRRAAFAQA